MLNEFWSKFKSGSDIRGTASEGVAGQAIDLTDETVDKIARGFCFWLMQKSGKEQLTVAVGHDSRISADRLSKCIINACLQSGVNVIFTGLSSTPSMFMITLDKELSCDASIQITASHHPFNKNGLKFFTKSGGLESGDITAVLEHASTDKSLSGKGVLTNVTYIDTYSKILVDFVREKTGESTPLSGKKIVVDAGNGAGGFYVEKVLKPLGADTDGSQFLEPDGMFPNHIPNPENKAAMQAICSAVKNTGADFGIIFDTDVDRAGAVDSSGREINRNRLIALISAILLEEKPYATIVTDSVTSDGLARFIKSKDGTHHRFKRGYKNVINEAIRLNSEGIYCPLAIETSGHAAFKENYFLDDGAYLVTRLLISLARLAKQGKDLSSLVETLEQPKEEAEIRISFNDDSDFKTYGQKIINELWKKASKSKKQKLAESNFEGVRINFTELGHKGWVLVRQSVHDPILPINIESDVFGGTRYIGRWLYEFLKGYEKLNLDNLINFIK